MKVRGISLSLAAAFLLASPMALAQLNTRPGNFLGYDIATVRYSDLLDSHRSSDELRALDGQISLLEWRRNQIELEARERANTRVEKTMRTAFDQAREELAEQRATSEAQLKALRLKLSRQVDAEMKALQSELEAELAAAYASSTSVTEAQLEDFRQNLYLVRARNDAAKRLELEKGMKASISEKESLNERQLSDFGTVLAARFRDERLNLQLQVQNSPDDGTRSKASERLRQIAAEVERLRSAKGKELESDFAEFRTSQAQEFRKQWIAYKTEAEREFLAKIETKKRELATSSPELQAKAKKLKSRLEAELARKKTTLSARLQAEAEESRERYEAEERNANIELQELKAKVVSEVAQFPPEVKDEVAKVTARLEQLQEERNSLLDSVRKSINTKVGEIARRLDHEMVIGISAFEYSQGTDLTDYALAGVATLEK